MPFPSTIHFISHKVILRILGWYVVWRLFLRKFKFIRELLGVQEPEDADKTLLKRENSSTSTTKASRRKVCLTIYTITVLQFWLGNS